MIALRNEMPDQVGHDGKAQSARARCQRSRVMRCEGMVEKREKEFRGHFSARGNFFPLREGDFSTSLEKT